MVAWLDALSTSRIFLSAVTVGELQAGVERTRRQDAAKAVEIESWVDRIAQSFEILPMDASCFREWARLMDRRPDHLLEDMMIAATARTHHLTLATRNVRDFAGVEVQLVNPFAI